MSFNSFTFFIFFPIVTSIYFFLPHRFRWAWLLSSSIYFYMSFIPYYILILLATILIDYVAGILIGKSRSRKKRKFFLVTSIISTCLVLFVFKYFNFFNANLSALTKFLDWNYPIGFLKLALPIGLSFHTFQSLSYVIEVFKRRQKPEYNFGIYALYVMFYPQLVAGPIERPQNLLHQFYEKHYFDYFRVTNGLKLMLWGLFKKMVIADRLAVSVNYVYQNPHAFNGVGLTLATIFFAFQIYCDFSGYSDIAIGAAQVMGFKLMDNFNRPYFSKTVSEFWRRWHISLSTWFRDYLYIPLGGNRVNQGRWTFNILVTFLVSGLWHGANWTYLFWGGLHGFYIIIEKFTDNFGIKKLKLAQVAITFILVCLAWVLFRAKNLTDALYIYTHLPTGWENLPKLGFGYLIKQAQGLGLSQYQLEIAVLSIIFMESVHLIQRHGSIRHMLSEKPIWLRWTIYYCLILSLIFLSLSNQKQFIYFQF